jgi:hypothetical protein
MAGCRTINIGHLVGFPLTQTEKDNCSLVERFLRSWKLTPEQEAQLRVQWARGNDAYLPPPIDALLDEVLDPDVLRIRLSDTGERSQVRGILQYKICISAAHAQSGNLNVEIEDILVNGNYVTASCVVSGHDYPTDGHTGSKGAFGASTPTGRLYSVRTLQLYMIENGRIKVDELGYGRSNGVAPSPLRRGVTYSGRRARRR